MTGFHPLRTLDGSPAVADGWAPYDALSTTMRARWLRWQSRLENDVDPAVGHGRITGTGLPDRFLLDHGA
jgi:hypothetical protein